MAPPRPSRDFRRTSVGWLVQHLANRFETAMAAELASLGLALGQFAILMRVIEVERQTQTDLGATFAMPAWKISRHLDALQSTGLVERQPDPHSRRTHRIAATEAARALLPRLQGVAHDVNARILAPPEGPEHGC